MAAVRWTRVRAGEYQALDAETGEFIATVYQVRPDGGPWRIADDGGAWTLKGRQLRLGTLAAAKGVVEAYNADGAW